jgi:hypothetical protein
MKTKTNTTIPTIQPSTNQYQGYGDNEIGAVKTDGLYELDKGQLGCYKGTVVESLFLCAE